MHARTQWKGIPVYPGGMNPYGADVMAGNAEAHKADLVITLMDVWALYPDVCRDLGCAHWMPVDCSPLGALDRGFLRASGGTAIAMSEFGRDQLSEAGFAPYYVPHGIDTSLFVPGSKKKARERLGIPLDAFVVGMNQANTDKHRKAWPEQLAAFSLFRQQHDDAILLAHAMPAGPGLNLTQIAGDLLGLGPSVRWSDRYKYTAGQFTDDDMVVWYQALDVLLQATRGEGFGLPVVEAQAVGCPVITTGCSALTEITGAGWMVDGHPFLQTEHTAWWTTPDVTEIVEALGQAYEHRGDEALAKQAREFAVRYDADAILPQWDSLLRKLEDQLA